MNAEEIESWSKYFEVTKNGGPRCTVTTALDLFSKEGINTGTAFDLGCGPGNDVRALLLKGWNVIATDAHPALGIYFKEFVEKFPGKYSFQECEFENVQWQQADLVNAGYSLPFCNAAHFKKVWNDICSNLKSGGRFSGQFFGVNDDWKELILHSKAEVEELLKDFVIEDFKETDRNDKTALGEGKHWHVFDIVARKK